MTITPQQCRAARAVLGLGVRDLARIADVSPNTIARLERGERMHPRTLAYLRGAIEAAGVIFVAAGEISRWGGPGIRYGTDEVLSPMAAVFRAFSALPNGHTQPEAAYDAVLDIFDRILDVIQDESGELDTWQRLGLQEAIEALSGSNTSTASEYMRHAITPPDNQSPDYPIGPKHVAAAKNYDLAYFRKCVAFLRDRGYGASAASLVPC